ncbi:MAG: hypothetical protein H0W66_14025, partial [Chthoniobacterales bacterium]|nr:hypothetical protein [Chthoniobacterales bacterium]
MKLNLTYARNLLLAADGTPHRSLQIRGPYADKQVQLMLEAGFLEATLHDGTKNSFTIIDRNHPFGSCLPRTYAPRTSPVLGTRAPHPSA